MNRVLLWPTIVLLLLGGVSFVVSRGQVARDDKAVVICNADDISTLDTARMSWQNDIRTAMGLWEGLVAYDPKTLAPSPGVAEKWEVSPDGKTYTFHLRANAKWGNGDAVTSADFLFAWKRVLQPKTAADYVNLFFYVKNAQAYYESLVKPEKDKPKPAPVAWESVGFSAPDARTIVITLANPCTFYLDLIAFPCYFPLHEASMAKHLDTNSGEYNANWTHPPSLVTNGAFRLAEWAINRHLKMVPNEHYWDREAVKASAIIIKKASDKRNAIVALNTGEVDVLTFLPDDFGPELIEDQAAGKRKDVHYRPVFGTYYYVFNCSKPPFDDKRVRKALSLVVNKKRIVEDVTRLNQRPLDVIVPPDSIGGYESPKGIATGMDEKTVGEARKLLSDAGYPGGKGLPEIEILVNNEAGHMKVAQAIGQMWQEALGLKVVYRAVERQQFRTDRRQTNFMIARGGWYGDYGDPTTWLDLCKSNDNNNDGKFKSPAFDALLDKAAAEPDAKKRFAILKEAEEMLVTDEFAYLPLYQYSDGYMFDESKVGGLFMNVRTLTQFKYLHRK